MFSLLNIIFKLNNLLSKEKKCDEEKKKLNYNQLLTFPHP